MGAKDLVIKAIPAKLAREMVTRNHYSGKFVQNSSLHLGVFYKSVLHGAMQFGSPMDKGKVIGLVVNKETKQPAPWNDMLELNRMAFDDVLPRNSESRAIAIALKLIRKHTPNIKWILSYADGTQAGNGGIYRASGFDLTQIKPNGTIYKMPSGDVMAAMALEAHYNLPVVKKQSAFLGVEHKYRTRKEWEKLGAKPLEGNMYRYIKILDEGYTLNCERLDYVLLVQK